MTPLALWAAVALVALVATACWAILARETAVYVTSGLSFTAWAWLALVGGDVAMLSPSGLHWVRVISSLQFTALALAIISLVVFALRLLGAYPSPQQNAAETTGSAEASAN
ncbi:MAG: hypothetical protein ABEI98_04770 [Halorhabdus sp.]